MKRIAHYIAGRSDWSFDVVVHIGAGMGGELAAYRQMDLRRTVLIEAHPDLAAVLRQRTGAMPGVEVRTLALAPDEGDAQLLVFNNARESSLYPPTRLLQHFPNLTPAGSAPVRTVRLERLLREAAADPSIGNLLVLDVAALAPAAFDGCALDVLHTFTHIAVLTTALPLYAGTAGEPELRDWLEQAGYRQHYESDDTVAPFRELLFVRDDAAVAALRLTLGAAELAALRATCAAQAEQLQACLVAATQEREEHARLRAELLADSAHQAALANQAQAELAQRAHDEQLRMARLTTLAASLLARTGGAPAHPALPSGAGTDAEAQDSEAFLGDCIDSMVAAWTGLVHAHADERAAADAARRALQELEAECGAGAGRERALQAELALAEAARAALVADAGAQAARADQLGLEMVRAQAQIGLIRDLLLRETEF